MDDFEKELKSGFLEEATQLLTETEKCFLDLETSPKDSTVLDKIFRLAHNLKGSAKAVGFDGLGEFAHEFETYLLKVKVGDIQADGACVSLLLRCNDHIVQMVDRLKADGDAKTDSTHLLQELRNGAAPLAEKAPAREPDETNFENSHAETDSGMTSAFVPLVFDVAASPAAESVKPAASTDEGIRVSIARLEKLLNFVGEMVILQTVLKEQANLNSSSLLRKTVHQLGKVTKEVQDISMSLRMVPLRQTFQKMQRIVRDTSADLEKKVNLVLLGEDTELDKTVLEKLGDPLVHLIRNGVDHGIESPEVRIRSGKPPVGQLTLNAYHQSGSLILEVRDDGAGLDPNRLRAKAIEKGILKAGEKIEDREAYQLIFHSGFSTKTVVSDVSGRGVGMDVVKTNIELIQGDIQIETELGKGTCFKIRLPLTMAIIDAMIVRTNEERFIIPLSHVHESVRPTEADIHFVSGMGELFSLRGETLPLYRLSHLLASRTAARPACEGIAIVVRSGRQPFAILVDDIIGQSQVVIKQLGREHQNLKGFSGSAILGDGRPALILELPDLVNRCKAQPIHALPKPQLRRSA